MEKIKAKLRIPTKDTYAFVEVDVESSPEGIKQLYSDLIALFNGSDGIKAQTFYNDLIELANSGMKAWGTADNYASMNEGQQAVFQAFKRLTKRQ